MKYGSTCHRKHHHSIHARYKTLQMHGNMVTVVYGESRVVDERLLEVRLLLNSLIVMKLDNCNSLFACSSKQLTDKLQRHRVS